MSKRLEFSVILVLRLAALVTFMAGLLTLIIPEMVISVFDGFNTGNFHFVRFLGTALIGFSVMNWLYSNASDSIVVIPALYGNIVSLLLAIGVDTAGIIIGTLSTRAWALVVLHAVFLIAFSYVVYQLDTSRR